MRPKTAGILESSLYVSDLPRSVRFYQETFGFSIISEFGERGCAMHAGTRLVAWESWLREKGVAVEEKRSWETGGWSLYFRDPDRHLLELATPGTWSVY
jgi:catechol 2,3-dioxygenase-like lactoylglutathione lyase family enzyme